MSPIDKRQSFCIAPPVMAELLWNKYCMILVMEGTVNVVVALIFQEVEVDGG